MKKLIFFFGIVLLIETVWAQTEYDNETPKVGSSEEFVGFNKKIKEKKDLSRIRIGGTGGLLIRNNELGFSFSPLIGYQLIEDRIEVGTGIIYSYYRYKDSRNLEKIHEIGSANYLRAYVWEGFFLQARGDVKKFYGKFNSVSAKSDLIWNIFPGAGYQFAISNKAFFNLGLEINAIKYQSTGVAQRAPRVISPFFNFQFSL